jgi:cysteinyl-tRNA synthetase
VPLVVHNTLTRSKEEFVPQVPDRVGMYVCGPTVYDLAHIGNARPAVVFDVFYRLLQRHFAEVVYVRNITDVEDKINAAAAANGESIGTLTARTEKAYLEDMASLGVLPPSIAPRVTEHIPEIISMIERLVERRHAYEAEGHVLFEVATDPAYGSLSGHSTEELLAGARVEVAPYKRAPGDFVLWKPSTPEQPGWDSPWGRGRPGWHIECSAMIERHLGETIDIHGGGGDLIFPHHENEMAQGSCVHGGKTYARYWMHNGMLTVNGEKMSKSLGNFFTVRDVLAKAPGEAVRFYLLTTHYRQSLDWTDEGLRAALLAVDRFYLALRRVADVEAVPEVPPELLAALEDDLNTPLAIAHLHALVSELNKAEEPDEQARLKGLLLGAVDLFGILQQEPAQWFGAGADAAVVEKLIAERLDAKKRRDFAAADKIRDDLKAQGIIIEDGPGGTSWRRAG